MKHIINVFIFTICIIPIGGCAQKVWVKPNAGQGEFERDRYVCLQQSQQRVGAAQVNAYGGTAVDTMTTNDNLYYSCMSSRGWGLQNKEVIQEQSLNNQARIDNLRARSDVIEAKLNLMCDRDDLKEFYKKTSCRTSQLTFEQIADVTTITSAQKIALSKRQSLLEIIDKEQESLMRQDGESGLRQISIEVNFSRPENEKNNLDLYNEKITWGQYNKRRKEIFIEGQKRSNNF